MTIVTAAGLMLSACAADTTAVAPVERYHGSVTQTREGIRTVIGVRGVITPAVATAFSHALRGSLPGLPVTIVLDSPGGYTRSGYAMIEAMMNKRAEGAEITTLVRRGAACESMCVGVFMAGDRRQAERGADFMVHAPRSDTTGMMSARATREMVTRLVSLGASDSWIRRISAKGAFSGTVDHHESAEQLFGGGANVVTELIASP
jgi:ATP-dependent protease ClpP protease subunit